ncbi:MAG: MarR family transcriptional regulator [Chloroflexi bacterium]|jgi:MarR family 2-MHQ and catechol resistance regulon transcriptional repressor|nr:MarR family transcriptional regulator [Anaerolineaceae bacterium]NMB90423.1 MarR family transcriptional regulator [Chloroflexota bacterium]
MPTHYSGDPATRLALDTFIKFTRAANAFQARLFQSPNLGDLTPSQFGVLETLYHLGPLCQGELSSKLLTSTGNMTLVLDNLEKRTYVQRVRDQEDRRLVRIHLTPQGEALIREVFPRVAEAIRSDLGVLSAEEQANLGHLCKKLGKRTRD